MPTIRITEIRHHDYQFDDSIPSLDCVQLCQKLYNKGEIGQMKKVTRKLILMM